MPWRRPRRLPPRTTRRPSRCRKRLPCCPSPPASPRCRWRRCPPMRPWQIRAWRRRASPCRRRPSQPLLPDRRRLPRSRP
ncbi:MAG: hypothetical protein E5V40_08290 [Mesorhizobium sp.]|nr:MAG: hypothetical protein E5V40_08290 [Mesorhizobium sp.]